MAKAHEVHPVVMAETRDQKISRHSIWSMPFERQLLACSWVFVETATVATGHKVILKPKIPTMSRVMSEEH